MSPEEVRCARRVGARTDVWGLGVILYELLTGRVPFEGESSFAVFMGIAADEPVSSRFLRPEIPVALEDVVLRCLQKDVRWRIQTVPDLALALAPFGSRRVAMAATAAVSIRRAG
jgi:serine/threonine-protein kinase